MKQSRTDDIIEARMRPGAITRDGLLGADRRKLRDILDADDAAVRRLGLSHAAIAARMRDLRDAGARGLGEPIRVDDTYEIRVDAARGRLPCPFGHSGLFDKEFTEVLHVRSGERITFSRLNIHLVEAHGFYEGLGAPFRQDPERLARVLGLI